MSWYKRSSSEELALGIEIEREHLGTIRKIEKAIESGSPLSDDEICELIAKDHIAELSDYYSRLKKMEGE